GCLSDLELHVAPRALAHLRHRQGPGDHAVPRLDAVGRTGLRRSTGLRTPASGRSRSGAAGDQADTGRDPVISPPVETLGERAIAGSPPRAMIVAHGLGTPRGRRVGDPAFRIATIAAGLLVLVLAAVFAATLWTRSAQARATFGWSFLLSSTWDPV